MVLGLRIFSDIELRCKRIWNFFDEFAKQKNKRKNSVINEVEIYVFIHINLPMSCYPQAQTGI